jgi:hypothetical protein
MIKLGGNVGFIVFNNVIWLTDIKYPRNTDVYKYIQRVIDTRATIIKYIIKNYYDYTI